MELRKGVVRRIGESRLWWASPCAWHTLLLAGARMGRSQYGERLELHRVLGNRVDGRSAVEGRVDLARVRRKHHAVESRAPRPCGGSARLHHFVSTRLC